jgi:hypothetical protein
MRILTTLAPDLSSSLSPYRTTPFEFALTAEPQQLQFTCARPIQFASSTTVPGSFVVHEESTSGTTPIAIVEEPLTLKQASL